MILSCVFLQVYTNAVFEGSDFADTVNKCGGDEAYPCLFAAVSTVESTSSEICTAELFINRFMDIPVYLKCLTTGYGPRIANKMIKALDEFFELNIMPELTELMMEQVPQGFVYHFASPYASDRKYCGHGAYYANGYLVDQVPCNDGTIITKFMYGFDVIYYRPKDFVGVLLEDEDIPKIIDLIFEQKDFLSFLKVQYPGDDLIQDLTLCTVIDPDECEATFPPTENLTPQPSKSPSYSPVFPEVILTPAPTIPPTSEIPTLFPTITNPPTKVYEPTSSPTVTSSPSSAPTPIPSTLNPTQGNSEAGEKPYDLISYLCR
jgi:hypothetical protein